MGDCQLPEGMKRTKQRVDVYTVLSEAEAPMTAIEIYENIARRDGGCSYAVSTIYRVLSAFEEKGFVEKSTLMGEDMAVYEWKNIGDHKHYAICLGCHKKVALKKCPFQRISQAWQQTGDEFTVTGHKLELYGYCKECQNTGADTSGE